MTHSTFTTPDLTTFCGLDDLGLTVVGQRLEPDQAVLACRVSKPDAWCHRCGCQGTPRDTVVRRLAHTPIGWRPTLLEVTVRRYRCDECAHVWRQDMTKAAAPRAKISRGGLAWTLEGIVVQHLSVSRVAQGLGVAWNTANNAILTEGRYHLINNPTRFDGVRVLGVDEHVWRHTRHGDKYVTVIIDLTPVRDRTGPARLLDMVEGRSKHVFATWLKNRPAQWRQGVDVVAMDGFTGFKTATAEELPGAVAVMDPFHVVRLASDALDQCRRRVQVAIHGRRGRKYDPLYQARRTLLTGQDLLTTRQHARLRALFASEEHREVKQAWRVYQRLVHAYRQKKRDRGRTQLTNLITKLTSSTDNLPVEIARLGQTLKKRADDILAYFDHPRTSNGPTEALNGRLEHLRGLALGFRNLTNYIARSLLETGGFRPALHPKI